MRGSKKQQRSVWLAAVIAAALTGCGADPSNAETTVDEPTGEECLAESEASSCEALYCRWHETLEVDASDCTASPSEGGCFTLEGQPIGQAAEIHAYYRMQGDQLKLMLYAYDCASPFGWTECTANAESPAECACLCGTTTVGGEQVYCGESPLCGE